MHTGGCQQHRAGLLSTRHQHGKREGTPGGSELQFQAVPGSARELVEVVLQAQGHWQGIVDAFLKP